MQYVFKIQLSLLLKYTVYNESLGLFYCVLAYVSEGHFSVEVTLRPFDWL
jgi:hypothetical protein